MEDRLIQQDGDGLADDGRAVTARPPSELGRSAGLWHQVRHHAFDPKVLGLVIAWLAAAAVIVWLELAGRERALQREQRVAFALTDLVEQQTVRTFQAIQLSLASVADAHHLARPKENDPMFRELMTRRLQDLPFLRAIFIIGREGWIRHDTDFPNTPRIPLDDRPYFRAHALGEVGPSVTWPPVLSRSGTGWFLPITHALSQSDDFEGVVVAALQADHFTQQFRRLNLSSERQISIFHLDGSLVAAFPPVAAEVGTKFLELPMFDRLAAASRGAFWSEKGMLPGERLVSYRVVENAPFVVRLSVGRDALLASWLRTAVAGAIAMIALTMSVLWLALRLIGEGARRDQQRQRQLQAEKLQALGQLTGGIAHDMANMLNVIGINLALLRRVRSDPAAVEEVLDNAERALKSGTDTVEHLVSFARMKPLALVPMRLDVVLEEVRPLLEQAAGPESTLVVEAVGPIPEVACDRGQLDMALVNVVVNARQAMGGRGRIRVQVFPCHDTDSGVPQPSEDRAPFVCIAVRDTGPGMPEAVRERAFEPFYTTKGDAGTGLGLSQVYAFVDRLGGRVSIRSSPGAGCTVHLYFPVISP